MYHFQKINSKLSLFLTCLFFYLVIFGNCKKKEESHFLKKYDTASLVGTWELTPSGGEKIVFEPGNKIKVVESDGKLEEIFVKADKNGVRFLRSETDISPIGYFLFSEMNKTVWGGIWKNEVVRLEKVTPKKGSILE